MLPLRAFFYKQELDGSWTVEVLRDLDSLKDAWRRSLQAEQSAVIHIGFWRPDSNKFTELSNLYPGKLLLTASAYFALRKTGRCTERPVSSVDGEDVYLVLSGWGYDDSFDNQPHTKSGECQNSTEKKIVDTAFTVDWLKNFLENFPEREDNLRKAGIIDEQTYLTNESTLQSDLRSLLGACRLIHKIRAEDLYSPSHVAAVCPPWLRNFELSQLCLPVRALNVYRRAGGIQFVRDLSKLDSLKPDQLHGFGKKSAKDTAITIMAAMGINHADLNRLENDLLFRKNAIVSLSQSAHSLLSAPNSFLSAVDDQLNSVNIKQAHVVKRRMGYFTPCSTLQEVGDELGVSRERIRQIESKVIERAQRNPTWGNELEKRVQAALSNREAALPVVGLTVADAWFTGVEDAVSTLSYALENFASNTFYVIRVDSVLCISRLSQQLWDHLVVESTNLLKASVSLGWTTIEARQNVEALLSGAGEELREELFFLASKNAIFMKPSGSDDSILVAHGRGAESYVKAILLESERPLHYSEISELVGKKTGRKIDYRRAHNAAIALAYQFGRGTYGLSQHFPLTEDETEEVVSEAEAIIEEGDAGKQWHCAELFNELAERGFDYDGKLDKYILHIALSRSQLLSNLGRLVWAQKTNRKLTQADRIDVRQAVESLLQSEDGPLTAKQIRQRLSKQRGLGQHFQIHAEGRLVRLAPGLWGLLDRDLPISPREQENLTERVEARLTQTQRGIHRSELLPYLHVLNKENHKNINPVMLSSLVQKSDKIKLSSGGYLYLAEWEGARRILLSEAVVSVLKSARPRGLTFAELWMAVSELLGRDASEHSIRGQLVSLGAIWHENTRWWTLAEIDSNNDLENH